MIYLITRTDNEDYDEYEGVVVRAASREAALRFVTEEIPDPYVHNRIVPRYIGFKKDQSNLACKVIKPIGSETEEILSRFKAG